MPLFEYTCRECGDEFEKIVSSSTVRVRCPACDARKVEKKLSVFAVAGGDRQIGASTEGCGACGADQPGSCGW